MTLLELVTHLRNNILDDNGGQGVDWSNYNEDDFDSIQLRWGNEELVANINESINQVYRRVNPVKDIIPLSVVATTKTYNLPSYVYKILGIRREDGVALKEEEIMDLWNKRSFDTEANTPTIFIPDTTTNNIRLYPTPIASETMSMLVYRFPKIPLKWSSPALSPELRDEYQVPMLSFAANLCYLKDEANTLDPNRASTFLAMFDREFPFTSVYSNIRKGRTANKVIKYGGY